MKVDLSVEEVALLAGIYGGYLKSAKNNAFVSEEDIKEIENTIDPIIAKMYDCFSDGDEKYFEILRGRLKL